METPEISPLFFFSGRPLGTLTYHADPKVSPWRRMSSYLEELPLGSPTLPWEAQLAQTMDDVGPIRALCFISYREYPGDKPHLPLPLPRSYTQPISPSHSVTTSPIPLASFQNFKFNWELLIFIFKLGLANPLHRIAV